MRSSWISRVKMKIRCSEGRSEDCQKNRKITGQRFRADNMDLDGSAAFVVKKMVKYENKDQSITADLITIKSDLE